MDVVGEEFWLLVGGCLLVPSLQQHSGSVCPNFCFHKGGGLLIIEIHGKGPRHALVKILQHVQLKRSSNVVHDKKSNQREPD